jgi:hypothetical protein
MNDEPFKVCRSCGAEYAPSAQECFDCGGQLVFRGSDGENIEPLSEDEAKSLVREGDVNYLRELAQELGRNGIRSAVVLHAPGPGT